MTEGFDVGLLDPLAHLAGSASLIVSDTAFLAACVRVEAALAGALADAGAEPAGAAVAARIAALAPLDVHAIAAQGAASGNPVLPLVAAIRAQLPEADQALVHRGATSQDVLDSAFMVLAADARQAIDRHLARVSAALGALAVAERHTEVAGRTLGQQGAPTTFGLRVAVLLSGVTAARHALAAARLPAQLGGSVGTLAVLADRSGEERAAAVRTAFAARLGLDDPPLPWHVQRAPIAALGAALALVVGALGRIGLEVAHLASTELGEVQLAGTAGAGASSAMPQKRNPVPAVLLVAAARQAPQLAATLFGAGLAADDRPAGDWHAEWQPLRALLRLALDAAAVAADLVPAIEPDRGRMASNLALTRGAVHAERVQAVLAPILGAGQAARVVREALAAETDFVTAVRAAVPESAGAALDAVLATGGPIGLSDRFIDAAVAAAERDTRGDTP